MRPPFDPANCVVYGFVVDLRNKPSVNKAVRAFRDDSTITSAAGRGVTNKVITTYTKSDGYFELEILRGQLVTVVIPDQNIQKKFVVPDQDNIDYFTITTDAPP